MKFKSDSFLKTRELGSLLAKEILSTENTGPIIIALNGNLGAGKTTFIRGFAGGLGVKNKIVSPTFVIFRHYRLKKNSRAHLFHMDAYRIGKISELNPLGFRKIITLPGSITIVEWPEKIKKALPKNTLWISLKHGKKENERILEIKNEKTSSYRR